MPLAPKKLWLAVVSLLALQTAVAFRAAAHIHFCGSYDPAWYYSVAVNFAEGRGLTDGCLWHLLGPPPTVVRPAGDYWPCGWPFALGCLMRVCGTSFENTAYLMAGLSLMLPLAVAALVWRWGQPWYTAWLAGAMLSIQGEPTAYLSTDSNLSYALVTVGGLLVLSGLLSTPDKAGKTAWTLAGAIGMLGAWLRGEGFILWLAGAVVTASRKPHALACWSLGGITVAILQVALNLTLFGHPVPMPRAAVPWIVQYGDLSSFQAIPTASRWLAQGPLVIGYHAARCLWMFVCYVAARLPWPLTAAAAVGARNLWVVGGVRATVCFLVLSFLVPPLIYPIIANPARLLVYGLPLLCALAAPAVVDWTGRLRRKKLGALVVGAIFCYQIFWPLPGIFITAPEVTQPYPSGEALAQQLEIRSNDVVMCSDPWQVSACIGVNSVMCPSNGTSAIYQAIARYRPRYLLAHEGDPATRFLEQSAVEKSTFGGIRARERLHTISSRWVELTYD